MYPRKDEASGRYGYWGRDGWAIDPQFAYAHRFLSGYAAVDLVDGRFGLLGTDGTLHPLDAICGGRTPIKEEYSSIAFLDLESEPSRYAAVRTEARGRREWGLIDTSLAYRPLPDEVFSAATDVRPYGEYVVLFRASGRAHESSCGLFNLGETRLQLTVEYSWIYPSRESIWAVKRAKGDHPETDRSGFYDPRRHAFLPGSFWEALPFSCGFGAVRHEHAEGSYFVDEALRPAFDARFDDVGRFSNGLAAVYKDADAGYIDTTGRMRLLLPYERLQPFNEYGLAIANRDESEWDIDIIDRAGQPRLAGLETAVFWEGDFPYFEASKDGETEFFDINLNKIF